MTRLNEIIEWSEWGSEYRLYIKHFADDHGKACVNIIFEDATHEKVTEINIPNKKLKAFLTAVNGNLLSKQYTINL